MIVAWPDPRTAICGAAWTSGRQDSISDSHHALLSYESGRLSRNDELGNSSMLEGEPKLELDGTTRKGARDGHCDRDFLVVLFECADAEEGLIFSDGFVNPLADGLRAVMNPAFVVDDGGFRESVERALPVARIVRREIRRNDLGQCVGHGILLQKWVNATRWGPSNRRSCIRFR